jgi:pyridoxine/pyridoxamine 5'-phosphate oxidase
MPGIRDEERALQRAMEARLGREQTVWLATVRSDGRPHLVPVWFVWYDQKVYICTSAGSQKMVNLKRNGQAAVALPDTADVLVIEGQVAFPLGETVDILAQEFSDKYGWSFLDDSESDWRLVEITPTKVLAWNMHG